MPYTQAWQAMREFTDARSAGTDDQLWVLEHPPVYTLGQAGKAGHILDAKHIPVVKSDRGGQVTYHGPGQVIVYTLLDLRRARIGVRELVTRLENSVIGLLQSYGVESCARRDAPGVYVDGSKIAALGLRVRKGCSYHGLSLNVDMDLAPFAGINPCGYAGLPVTSIEQIGLSADKHQLVDRLLLQLTKALASDSRQHE